MTTLETISSLVEQSKDFPNAIIEYSFELPKHSAITKDNFLGVKARYNPQTKKANIIYTL